MGYSGSSHHHLSHQNYLQQRHYRKSQSGYSLTCAASFLVKHLPLGRPDDVICSADLLCGFPILTYKQRFHTINNGLWTEVVYHLNDLILLCFILKLSTVNHLFCYPLLDAPRIQLLASVLGGFMLPNTFLIVWSILWFHALPFVTLERTWRLC